MAKCHPDQETKSVCSFIWESAGLSDKVLCPIFWGFFSSHFAYSRERGSNNREQLDTFGIGKEHLLKIAWTILRSAGRGWERSVSQTHQKLGQDPCLLLCFLRLENKPGGNNFCPSRGTGFCIFSSAGLSPCVYKYSSKSIRVRLGHCISEKCAPDSS